MLSMHVKSPKPGMRATIKTISYEIRKTATIPAQKGTKEDNSVVIMVNVLIVHTHVMEMIIVEITQMRLIVTYPLAYSVHVLNGAR